MTRKLFATALFVIAQLASAPTGYSAPGDSLYVQKPRVNIRTKPGTDSPILMKLNKGHQLIEFSRRGDWINVGVARADGKDGWIHSSLTGATFPGGASVAPPDPRFDRFVGDVERLNDRVRPVVGFSFFPKVENLGDGIVQLTAHDRWLAASRSDREANLHTLYKLWAKREGSDLPIAVHIIDSRGNLVMQEARR